MDDIESDEGYIHGEVAGRMDFVERVGMYAEAGLNTFCRAQAAEMKAAGFGSKANARAFAALLSHDNRPSG